MFQTMLPPLMSQATRIAKHDDDLVQNIISMAFLTYNSALSRGKNLSIGELVNFMKYRASDFKKGKRLPVGSVREKTTQDVYNIRNYFHGHVKLLSLDFSTSDNECREDAIDGLGELTAATACRDYSDNVLFEVGFESFIQRLSPRSRQVFMMRLAGYNCSEIIRTVHICSRTLAASLNTTGRMFIDYFELPESYLTRYGIAC